MPARATSTPPTASAIALTRPRRRWPRPPRPARRWHRRPVVVARRGAVAPASSAVGRRPKRSRPYGKLKAVYRDRNLFLTDSAGGNGAPITTDGSEKARIKYGTAQLGLRRGVEPDHRDVVEPGEHQGRVLPLRREAGPRLLHPDGPDQGPDRRSTSRPTRRRASTIRSSISSCTTSPRKQSIKLDIRDGKPWSNDVVGHYVYNVRWSPDGKELLVNRTNRRQNIMEFAACSPETGKCRVVIREEWPTGWVENRPAMTLARRQQPFPLGVGAERLQELLSL